MQLLPLQPLRDYEFNASAATLLAKMSVKDITLFTKAIGYMNSSLRRRTLPQPLEDQYAALIAHCQDIVHLPKPTFYHRHVPVTQSVEIRSSETNIKSFVMELILHNNTYNVDILKAALTLRQLHHTVYKEGNHAAFGFILECWLLNDELGEWEPLVENLDVTFVSSLNEATVTTNKNKEVGLL